MDKKALPPRFRSARVIEVIEITVAEGEGIEGDPVRLVRYYFSLDGELLARRDRWEEEREEECDGE